MRSIQSRPSALLVLTLACAAPLAAQTPLDTAFTYQGQLRNAGMPADGLHDLRFSLYDADLAGAQIGAPVCVDDVQVTEGRFTAVLDFGDVFAGEMRFLEIEVRPNAGEDCADPAGYTLLEPRQELTATPHASFSQSTRGISVDANNNVGIGATTPDAPLRVVGDNAAGSAGIYASAGTGLNDQSWTILGENSSLYGIGVQGRALATTAQNYGVWGESFSPHGYGVTGLHSATSGGGAGVLGMSDSPDGWAGFFGGRVLVTENLGVGTTAPGFPLTFLDVPGDKISLWGSSGDHYGFGIQPSLLQIHTIGASDDIAFGYGSSASFTETMRIKGNGNVGIGTDLPASALHIAPDSGITLGVNPSSGGYTAMKIGLSAPSGGYATIQGIRLSGSAWGDLILNPNGGNVGIGSTTPAQKLSVAGTIESTTGGFRFPDGSTQTTAAAAQGPPSHFAEFHVPGTYTWTAPAGVTQVVVQVRGAGGSGGGGSPCCCFCNNAGSGGGGSGGYARALVNVSPGATYTVIVGAGGAGVPEETNGMPGGESRFQSPAGAALIANGGGGGGAAQIVTPGNGGAGGAAVPNGQVATAGNAGAWGSTSGGAGGASVPGVLPQTGTQVSITLPSGVHVEPSLGPMTQPGGQGGTGSYSSSAAGGSGYVLISW